MFNVCNPTHDFLTQILNFFLNFLIKTHTPTSVVYKLLHHINVIKFNNAILYKYCKTYNIDYYFAFVFTKHKKPSYKRCKNQKKKIFLVIYVYYSLTIELQTNKQTITCNFFNKLNLVRLFGLTNVLSICYQRPKAGYET